MTMTRVAIVARSPVLRSGLEALLANGHGLVIVGSAAAPRRASDADDVVSLLEVVAPLAPDVVVWVVDDRDGTSGLADVIASLRAEEGGRLGVVLLADLAEPRAAASALRAGARAVLPREAGADEIVAAVDGVAAGLTVLPPELADELLARDPAATEVGAAAPSTPVTLTPREREVLALLAQGLANKAIAPRLGISEHTVKAHVASIFEKLHAGTRAEAVVTAARSGLLML